MYSNTLLQFIGIFTGNVNAPSGLSTFNNLKVTGTSEFTR